ncbi:serine hydrolase domain-containing protein [uncultured Thiodictyon sp.]|uniref:serine hydrolase domain-containing protein n=1 Tax=uncultured Thiodictyon sp. TaxID=1846217 RepID=UPI0025D97865|nr:serine hydrolase domain-containing protein [uncultured Thiodictyon sp.]
MKRSCKPLLAGLGVAIALSIAAHAGAQTSLNPELEPYLKEYDLPALAAGVVKNGELVAAGAVGTRRVGENIPVTLDDRFHIGSDTKAMTSLLAAILVEQGKLQWTTTVGEVFPELVEQMDPRLRTVTIQQLLSHTSGLPSDNEAFKKLLDDSFQQSGNLDELRYWLVKTVSSQPLAADPGAQFAYSNLGYVVAGAIIERKAGKTWDELVTEWVFAPLGLKTAGLGPQASVGKIDAPLGHLVADGKTKAVLAGPNGDNPLILGPAGIAHMSVLDFARWAGWNAGEGARGPNLVTAETLEKLHTPIVDVHQDGEAPSGDRPVPRYGFGWGTLQPDWATHPFLTHTGSNGENLATIWVAPSRDFAMVVMTNIAGQKANQALVKLAHDIHSKFGGE